MAEKSESVVLRYKDSKVYITGTAIKGMLEITSSELTKLYWGKDGSGVLHIKIED